MFGAALIALPLYAAAPLQYEDERLRLRLAPRTPEQIAAFYEARGFPRAMLDRLAQTCFITVGIKNKSHDILWLDLDNWQFSLNGQPVQRIHRNEWKARWQAMHIPLASQSTFRWTLLPEQLDFRPNEREGGNVTLVSTTGKLQLDAKFDLGADRKAGTLHVTLTGIECAGPRS